MTWRLRKWMCGGFQAVRLDGERIFIYRRLFWEPAEHLRNADSYEFRWHGLSAGRLTSESAWNRRLKLTFMLDGSGKITEQDLLDISTQLARSGHYKDTRCDRDG